MSFITLSVGQAGCQGGGALFNFLAQEARPSSDGGWSEAADRFFYLASAGGRTRPTARAVLLDMEPKAVEAVRATADRGGWQFSRVAALTRQPGSGNNWAQGALHHGPAVRQQVLGMLRRQAERCDTLNGFLVLQSVAGGTGSGVGAAMTESLRDEYTACRILNHCIWPYDSGEVVVQPYNAVLSLASLAQHSNGVILAENESMSATCKQLLGVQRPSFADLNAVAARNLASLLLPCTQRQAPEVAAAPPPAAGRSMGGARAAGRGRPAWDSCAASPPGHSQALQADGGGAWDGAFSSGGRWEDEEPVGGSRGGPGCMLDPLADVCDRLCSQPGYRLLTLRSCPQLPPTTFDFTPFSWPSALRDLRQMQLEGRALEGPRSLGGGSGSSSSSSRRGSNKALANLLVLRGDQAAAADPSCFADAALYSATALQQQHSTPLAVAASNTRLAKQQMLATLLSNDQAPVAPVGRLLGKACQLLAARAYVHQYERYGLSRSDLEQAVDEVESMLERYKAL